MDTSIVFPFSCRFFWDNSIFYLILSTPGWLLYIYIYTHTINVTIFIGGNGDQWSSTSGWSRVPYYLRQTIQSSDTMIFDGSITVVPRGILMEIELLYLEYGGLTRKSTVILVVLLMDYGCLLMNLFGLLGTIEWLMGWEWITVDTGLWTLPVIYRRSRYSSVCYSQFHCLFFYMICHHLLFVVTFWCWHIAMLIGQLNQI